MPMQENLFKQICDLALQASQNVKNQSATNQYLEQLEQLSREQSIDAFYHGKTPASYLASQGEIEAVNFLMAHFNLSLAEVLSQYSQVTYGNNVNLRYKARKGIAILIRLLDSTSWDECKKRLDYEKNPRIYEAIYNRLKSYEEKDRFECHAIIGDTIYFVPKMRSGPDRQERHQFRISLLELYLKGGHISYLENNNSEEESQCNCVHCLRMIRLKSSKILCGNEDETSIQLFDPSLKGKPIDSSLLGGEYIRKFILGCFYRQKPQDAESYINKVAPRLGKPIVMFYLETLKTHYENFGYHAEKEAVIQKIAELQNPPQKSASSEAISETMANSSENNKEESIDKVAYENSHSDNNSSTSWGFSLFGYKNRNLRSETSGHVSQNKYQKVG